MLCTGEGSKERESACVASCYRVGDRVVVVVAAADTMEVTPSSPSGGGGGDGTAFDAWHRAPDGTLRREVWPEALGLNDTTSPECVKIPGHYHALLALAGETPETAQQIEKDLPRTGATFAVQGLLKPGALLTLKTLFFFFFFWAAF